MHGIKGFQIVNNSKIKGNFFKKFHIRHYSLACAVHTRFPFLCWCFYIVNIYTHTYDSNHWMKGPEIIENPREYKR